METYREETQRQKEKRMRGRRGGEINEERQLEERKKWNKRPKGKWGEEEIASGGVRSERKCPIMSMSGPNVASCRPAQTTQHPRSLHSEHSEHFLHVQFAANQLFLMRSPTVWHGVYFMKSHKLVKFVDASENTDRGCDFPPSERANPVTCSRYRSCEHIFWKKKL